ncbi:MAG: DUF1266 domain-containing protein [Candidatus Roizmanbacteria bacterium]
MENKDHKPNYYLTFNIIIVLFLCFYVLYRMGWVAKNIALIASPVLTPTLIPTPTITPSPTPVSNLSKNTQQWLIALGAILSVQNRESLDTLDCQIPLDVMKNQLLDAYWGVTDKKSAINTLEWLKNEGHSAEFRVSRAELVRDMHDNDVYYQKSRKTLSDQEAKEYIKELYVADFVWKYRKELATKNLMAWDYMRMVNVARWSYSVGYISELEAWNYMYFAGVQLQKNYSSWKEIGDHYVLGRTYWQASTSHPNAEASLLWLNSYASSPWKKYAWNMSLN